MKKYFRLIMMRINKQSLRNTTANVLIEKAWLQGESTQLSAKNKKSSLAKRTIRMKTA